MEGTILQPSHDIMSEYVVSDLSEEYFEEQLNTIEARFNEDKEKIYKQIYKYYIEI